MRLLKLNGCFLLQRFGMTGLVPCSRRSSRSSALSYALSPSIRFDGFTLRTRRSATGQSCASPVVNRMAIRRPLHDAANDAAIVHPLDAPDIRWQARFDPLPLLIAQPKQVPAHDPNPLPKRIGIVLSERKN